MPQKNILQLLCSYVYVTVALSMQGLITNSPSTNINQAFPLKERYHLYNLMGYALQEPWSFYENEMKSEGESCCDFKCMK